MANVYISLGSNIEPEQHIRTCMQQLSRDFPNISFSKTHETPAEGFNGEPFLNLVAGFETDMELEAVRDYLRKLENRHGRVRGKEKFSSRTLDADLLLYNQLNLQPASNLPHTDILRYAFVLYPLAEIAGDIMHPVCQRTIAEIAAESPLPRDNMTEVELI